MTKEDQDYKKSLEIYVKENEELIKENKLSIQYYEEMRRVFSKRIVLAKSQNDLSESQIKTTIEKLELL